MRIDGFQNIPAILQSFKADKSSKSTSGNGDSESSSSVSLSSFAGVLQSLQRESAHTDKAKGARVEQLAQQETAGNLPVDAGKIAAQLVDSQVINF